MDLDNTQITVNRSLVCSSTIYFTGDATTANLYNKTEIGALIANIPLSSYYTQTQLDTMCSTYYLKQRWIHYFPVNKIVHQMHLEKLELNRTIYY